MGSLLRSSCGDEEVAQGKCKIKEMGLPEGHAEKEGVMIEMANLEKEVLARLGRQGSSTTGLTGGIDKMTLEDAAREVTKTGD